jgi:hypothetical protein
MPILDASSVLMEGALLGRAGPCPLLFVIDVERPLRHLTRLLEHWGVENGQGFDSVADSLWGASLGGHHELGTQKTLLARQPQLSCLIRWLQSPDGIDCRTFACLPKISRVYSLIYALINISRL